MRNETCSLDDFQSEENKLLFLQLVHARTEEQMNAVKQIRELKKKLK